MLSWCIYRLSTHAKNIEIRELLLHCHPTSIFIQFLPLVEILLMIMNNKFLAWIRDPFSYLSLANNYFFLSLR